MRRRFVDFVIEHGGWPLSTRFLERLRNFGNYGLGAGAASTQSIEKSGEAAFLNRLAALWAERDQVTLVDVGAHHGNYTGAALAVFHGRARIECFEPDPANYERLTERLGNKARCHRLALGDMTGTARFFTNPAAGNRSSLYRESFTSPDPRTKSIEVEIDTLDRVSERIGIDHIDLLKLDVEGHELAVLRGAARLLAEEKVEVIQFEFGERNIDSRTFLRDFCDLLSERRMFRLSHRGLTPFEYGTTNEVFLAEANYVAAHRKSDVVLTSAGAGTRLRASPHTSLAPARRHE
jgi:FkbM family methyltransferase